ncbi:hypothetical protein ACROYT_G013836 [Oculina patagonica]
MSTSCRTQNFTLNKYDLVVVDEASMVSSPVFNVMANPFNRLNVRPVVIFAGDKCQQQLLQTVDGQVRATTSIINNGAFTSQNSVDEMQEGIVMCPDGPLSDDELWTAFRSRTDMSVMSVSRRGAQRINQIVVARQFAGQQPISAIPCDFVLPDAEDIPVFRHMEVVITENRDKAASVVNGQDAVVITSHNNTVVLQLPEGDKVFVYPVTRIDGDGERVTRYPFAPSYARTICKSQGQNIKHLTVWLDSHMVPVGTAYVALSRVRRKADISLLQSISASQLQPVPLRRSSDALTSCKDQPAQIGHDVKDRTKQLL